MFSTDFDVSLSGFSKSLTYVIYGVTKWEPLVRSRISTGDKELNKSGVTKEKLKLPFLVGIQVEVMDAQGEISTAEQKISVSK